MMLHLRKIALWAALAVQVVHGAEKTRLRNGKMRRKPTLVRVGQQDRMHRGDDESTIAGSVESEDMIFIEDLSMPPALFIDDTTSMPPTRSPMIFPTKPPMPLPTDPPSSLSILPPPTNVPERVSESFVGLTMELVGITEFPPETQQEWEDLTANYSTAFHHDTILVANFATHYTVRDFFIDGIEESESSARSRAQQSAITVVFDQTVEYNLYDWTPPDISRILVAAPFFSKDSRDKYVDVLRASRDEVLRDVTDVSPVLVPRLPVFPTPVPSRPSVLLPGLAEPPLEPPTPAPAPSLSATPIASPTSLPTPSPSATPVATPTVSPEDDDDTGNTISIPPTWPPTSIKPPIPITGERASEKIGGIAIALIVIFVFFGLIVPGLCFFKTGDPRHLNSMVSNISSLTGSGTAVAGGGGPGRTPSIVGDHNCKSGQTCCPNCCNNCCNYCCATINMPAPVEGQNTTNVEQAGNPEQFAYRPLMPAPVEGHNTTAEQAGNLEQSGQRSLVRFAEQTTDPDNDQEEVLLDKSQIQ